MCTITWQQALWVPYWRSEHIHLSPKETHASLQWMKSREARGQFVAGEQNHIGAFVQVLKVDSDAPDKARRDAGDDRVWSKHSAGFELDNVALPLRQRDLWLRPRGLSCHATADLTHRCWQAAPAWTGPNDPLRDVDARPFWSCTSPTRRHQNHPDNKSYSIESHSINIPLQLFKMMWNVKKIRKKKVTHVTQFQLEIIVSNSQTQAPFPDSLYTIFDSGGVKKT